MSGDGAAWDGGPPGAEADYAPEPPGPPVERWPPTPAPLAPLPIPVHFSLPPPPLPDLTYRAPPDYPEQYSALPVQPYAVQTLDQSSRFSAHPPSRPSEHQDRRVQRDGYEKYPKVRYSRSPPISDFEPRKRPEVRRSRSRSRSKPREKKSHKNQRSTSSSNSSSSASSSSSSSSPSHKRKSSRRSSSRNNDYRLEKKSNSYRDRPTVKSNYSERNKINQNRDVSTREDFRNNQRQVGNRERSRYSKSRSRSHSRNRNSSNLRHSKRRPSRSRSRSKNRNNPEDSRNRMGSKHNSDRQNKSKHNRCSPAADSHSTDQASKIKVMKPPVHDFYENFEGIEASNVVEPTVRKNKVNKDNSRQELEKTIKPSENKIQVLPASFKNDGSFLEMFKKMQETQSSSNTPTSSATVQKTADIKKPTLPFIGKRRGGHVLKTGMVKKVKLIEDHTVDDTPKDAWSLYLKEVKQYRQSSCEEEGKTRPLLK